MNDQTEQRLDNFQPFRSGTRTGEQWPQHRAKSRRQKAQRRALGRAPRNGKRFQ